MADPTLKDGFDAADAERTTFLERARDYASLTIADVLPPHNQQANEELPNSWRNIGGVGVENMTGRLMTSLFPVGVPWFEFAATAELRASQELSAEQKNEWIALLYARELVVASKMEASNYRLANRAALESLMICGNTLTRLAPDYDLRYYRFDN